MTKQRQQRVCCQKTMTGVSGVTNQSPFAVRGRVEEECIRGYNCAKSFLNSRALNLRVLSK